MDYKTKNDIKKSRNILIKSNDPRFNFGFHKEDDIDDFHKLPDIITMDQYDYSIKRDNGDESKLPGLVSISEAAAAQNLESLANFYREKFPSLPDEYHGILARYSTGTLMTKKETKNALKKLDKKPDRETPIGLEIRHGKFTLDMSM